MGKPSQHANNAEINTTPAVVKPADTVSSMEKSLAIATAAIAFILSAHVKGSGSVPLLSWVGQVMVCQKLPR